MPVSPEVNSGSDISVKLLLDGQPAPPDHPIVSVDVWLGVNKVGRARLTITDRPRDQQGGGGVLTFPISVSASYVPGAELTIELGYDGKTSPVFSGVIITHGLDIGPDDAPLLVIEAADRAMALTLARHSSVFTDSTDSDVIGKLLRDQGLEAEVTATGDKHPSLVQYACSDWDMVVLRAEANGMVVTTAAGKVSVAPPDTKAEPDVELVYGRSIRQAQLTMDATTQLDPSVVQSLAWDPATQSLAKGAVPSVDLEELGNLSSAQLAKVFAVKEAPQQTAASLNAADLSGWSKAELMRLRLAKVRGQLRCAGIAAARPAGMVALDGFGDRFNGNAFVSGVQHHLRAGDWTTELEIGLDPQPFAVVTPHISPPAAAGQVAGMAQLQVGIVDKPADDPEGQMRLPIRLPLVTGQTDPLWARLASPYATANKAGVQFWPEQDDEVIVAFMDNDPRFPVVLGSLYSKQKGLPAAFDSNNPLKCIVSRALLRIDFEEDKKAIQISTPAKQKIRLDDDGKTITIADANNNVITLAQSGITLESNGDIKLSAKGSIDLDAKTKLALKGAAGATLQGATVEMTADSTLTAKGNAEAKLTSPASVVVQGSLVRIN
ncbi:MAG: type VI secretion system tip protein VgrG [Cyanobacteriota bacterium]|nr:type VI secretion system tip protein VgrG [Cyanobacteriota bacterium]